MTVAGDVSTVCTAANFAAVRMCGVLRPRARAARREHTPRRLCARASALRHNATVTPQRASAGAKPCVAPTAPAAHSPR
eukprot:6125736-Prymnesium_polylepis.1